MADYKKALQAGFDAAKKAELARNEVKDVLDKLKTDVLAESGGTLSIEVRQFEEQEDPILKLVRSSQRGILSSLPQAKNYYQAVIAFNPKSEKSPIKELARWKQAKDGYPCSLIWGKQELQCEDRPALEQGLAQMLSDPLIGEKLYALAQLK
jgi:hypothetical protein